MKLNVISLFSGIGAFEKALSNLGIGINLINYCEVNKHSSKSYSLIHNVSEDKNLWDVTGIDFTKFKGMSVDLLTHGSPCTTFSVIGKQTGGDEGSGTASSLMWYSVKMIETVLPKVVIWENVKNVLTDKHNHNARKYLEILEGLGYENHYKVLNACDYGIPQNRERIFIVSILGGALGFEFPAEIPLDKGVYDYLDVKVDDMYYIDTNSLNKNNSNNWDKLGYGVVCDYRYDSGYRIRANGLCPTLLCKSGSSSSSGVPLVITDKDNPTALRTLSSRECFRLMGFSDEDYDKCIAGGVSRVQLGKQAGNSIVVNVLEAIFKSLYLNSNNIDTTGF